MLTSIKDRAACSFSDPISISSVEPSRRLLHLSGRREQQKRICMEDAHSKTGFPLMPKKEESKTEEKKIGVLLLHHIVLTEMDRWGSTLGGELRCCSGTFVSPFHSLIFSST